MRYDDWRVQTLEVENRNWVLVESGLWLHDKRNKLGRAHICSLGHTRWQRHKILWLGQSQHHGLDSELRAPWKHLVELDAKEAREFRCATQEIQAVQHLMTRLKPWEYVVAHQKAAPGNVPPRQQLRATEVWKASVQQYEGRVLQTVILDSDLEKNQNYVRNSSNNLCASIEWMWI